MKTNKLTNILVVAFIILNINLVSAQTDFRKTTWGMNPSAVKSVEASKILYEDQTKLIYECSLADIKGKTIYTFTISGQLMRAKYHLSPDYVNINYYIRDFKIMQDLLTQKYGETNKKSVITPLNKQINNEGEWAAYLSPGELRVEYKWSTAKTDITLTLSKIGDKPAIQIDYVSKEINAIDIKEKKDIILKDL